MSNYPKKFAFVKSSTNKVEEVKIAYVPEVSFIPSDGYQMVEVPFDSQVDAGWSYIFNSSTGQYEFVETVAVANVGAGGGKQRPPEES